MVFTTESEFKEGNEMGLVGKLKNSGYIRGKFVSSSGGFRVTPLWPDLSNWSLEMLVFVEDENQRPRRKNLGARRVQTIGSIHE